MPGSVLSSERKDMLRELSHGDSSRHYVAESALIAYGANQGQEHQTGVSGTKNFAQPWLPIQTSRPSIAGVP